MVLPFGKGPGEGGAAVPIDRQPLTRSPPAKGEGGLFGRVRELKTQKSIRHRLQRWRSGWFSRGDINLDESLSVLPPPLWWRVTRAVVVVVALAGIVVGVLLGSDGLRLLPCLQPNAQCVEVEAAEFTDICSFETMPYRMRVKTRLPKILSTLSVVDADIKILQAGKHLASTRFGPSNTLGDPVLRGGRHNMSIQANMTIVDQPGMALMLSMLLDEMDFQLKIAAHLQMSLHTFLGISITAPAKTNFYMTCGHVSCPLTICKYICQFGDYPLIDPDPDNPYPYVSEVTHVELDQDRDDDSGAYTITPHVAVWLRNFKALAAFPLSWFDLYFYDQPLPERPEGFRHKHELHDDNKLFEVGVQPFMLTSLENNGGKPFHMSMSMTMSNASEGQRRTAGAMGAAFLHHKPMFFYLTARDDVRNACPVAMRAFEQSAYPAYLTLNVHGSRKDGSDASLSSIGALPDVFRVNEVDLFDVQESKLSAFVNVTLLLPFQLEGPLPALHINGMSGGQVLGHFDSYPVYLPSANLNESDTTPPEPRGKGGMLSTVNTTVVLFAEATLSPWGIDAIKSLFPDVVQALKALNISLMGAPWQHGDSVVQSFLSHANITFSSIQSALFSNSSNKLFEAPLDIKPRLHLEVRSISYGHSNDTGLIAYVNFTYTEAFKGMFPIDAGSLRFTVMHKEQSLATVSVMHARLSYEVTQLEGDVFIANRQEAAAVRKMLGAYQRNETVSLRITDGNVDTSLALKELVPVNEETVKILCASEIGYYCLNTEADSYRSCLNPHIGVSAFSRNCLKVLLPRGTINVTFPDLRNVVSMGRGMANDLIDKVTEYGKDVQVKLVEVNSLRTIGLPLDIQLLLDKSLDAPPTAVSVGIKTTLGLGIMEIMDITYVVPPLTVNIGSPVTAEDRAANHTRNLFKLSVPKMYKRNTNASLSVAGNVTIANMYESAAWLEEVIADLSDKWIIAQPMATGDVWSYICEPLRLNISVADAISPNRAQSPGGGGPSSEPRASGGEGGGLDSIKTWSKIFFSLQSLQDKGMASTRLAFSQPWSEAIDIFVPRFYVSIRATSVNEYNALAPLITRIDPLDHQSSIIGELTSITFATHFGKQVEIATVLNMTAKDDGAFWGALLSDYVAGAQVAISLSSAKNIAMRRPGEEPIFDIEAELYVPSMPSIAIPIQDIIQDVSRHHSTTPPPPPPPAVRQDQKQQQQRRRLSLSDIWASVDPILLAVTQSVTAKVTSIQLLNLTAGVEDPGGDLSSLALHADLLAQTLLSFPDTFEVDISMPPIAFDIYTSTLNKILYGPQPRPTPWARAQLNAFQFRSAVNHMPTVLLSVDVTNVSSAIETANHLLEFRENVSFSLIGRAVDDPSPHLLSRINTHMRAQADLTLSANRTHNRSNSTSPPPSSSSREGEPTGDASKIVITTQVKSNQQAVSVEAGASIPRSANPLLFNLTMGAVPGLAVLVDDEPLLSASIDRLLLDQKTDAKVGIRGKLPVSSLALVQRTVQRLQDRQPVRIAVYGLIDDLLYPGAINASVVITPSLLSSLDLYTRPGRPGLTMPISTLLSPSMPFRLDGVDVIGGALIGSAISLPCLLKGFCDKMAGPDSGAIPMLVQARLTVMESIADYLTDLLIVDVTMPDVSFIIAVDGASDDLGVATIRGGETRVDGGSALAFAIGLLVTDAPGLQATAFRLFEEPLSITVTGASHQQADVLSRVLSLAPITVTVDPPRPERRVHSFFTVPTVCDKSWELLGTSEDELVIGITIPPLDFPVAITLRDVNIDVYYDGVPVLGLRPEGGDMRIGPEGTSTRRLIAKTLTDPKFQGGKFQQTASSCPYPSKTPEKCAVGSAFGKLLTYGDSGPLDYEAVVTFANPATPGTPMTIRMPVSAFYSKHLAGWDSGELLPSPPSWSNRDPPQPLQKGPPPTNLTCRLAREMVRDLYIDMGQTVRESATFWKKTEVIILVELVNPLIFDLDISHIFTTMYFRDYDGVPGTDRRYYMLDYPPSDDYLMVANTDLQTDGYRLPSNQAVWSPKLAAPLDQATLRETLSRLYDELVAHERLCVDMIDVIIGATIRKGDMPGFRLDLPVNIKAIPFYKPDACVRPPARPAAEKRSEQQQQQVQEQAEPPPPVMSRSSQVIGADGTMAATADSSNRQQHQPRWKPQ